MDTQERKSLPHPWKGLHLEQTAHVLTFPSPLPPRSLPEGLGERPGSEASGGTRRPGWR